MLCSSARLPATPAVLQHTWRPHLYRWAAHPHQSPTPTAYINHNHINALFFVAYVEPGAPPLSASSIVSSVMSVLGGVALILLFLTCYNRCVTMSSSSCCFVCLNVYTYTQNINPAEFSFGKPRRWRRNAVREEDEMESRENWRFGHNRSVYTFQFHNHSLARPEHRTEKTHDWNMFKPAKHF